VSEKKDKQAEKPVVTAEDAERMYAQAWPAKQAQVMAEAEAALDVIGQKYGVTIRGQISVLPAFLAQPAQATLPPQS